MSLFDEAYKHAYTHLKKPNNWDLFWKNVVKAAHKTKNVYQRQRIGQFSFNHNYIIRINDQKQKYTVGQQLGSKRRKQVVIVIPDYQDEPATFKEIQKSGFTQYVIFLKDSKKIRERIIEPKSNEPIQNNYLIKNIMDPEALYMKELFIEAYQLCRWLFNELNPSYPSVYLWGHGIGASIATFLSYAFPKYIKAQILQHPLICDFTNNYENLSNYYIDTIKQYIKKKPKNKQQTLQTLEYFDCLFFSNLLKTPTCMIIDLHDKNSLPKGAFALFHHLPTENKTMHICTNKSNQHKKIKETKDAIHIVTNYIKSAPRNF